MDCCTFPLEEAFTALCIGGLGEPRLSSRSLSPIIASSCLVSVQKIRAFTFTPSWVHLSMVSFSPRCSLCEPRAFQAGHCLLQGGVLFLILLGLWLTSALWFFRKFGMGI